MCGGGSIIVYCVSNVSVFKLLSGNTVIKLN